MKRSLTTLCLLLCLAAAAAAQAPGANANANANAAATPVVAAQNANTNADANAGANVNGTSPVTLVVQPGQTAKIEVGQQPEQPKGLDPLFKDRVDVVSKLGTPISLIVAVILAWQQIKKNREERERNERDRKERQDKDREEKDKDREQSERNRQQREEDVAQRKVELRWRKAQLAREMLKVLNDDAYATDMMTMLDWNDREFLIKSSRGQSGGKLGEISWEEMWAALRVNELHFDDKEKFIRDCADAFFGRMQTIEHYLTIDLIDLEDVAYPFDYYVSTFDQNPVVFENFVREYHPRAASFIRRLREFESAKAAAAAAAQTTSPPLILSPPEPVSSPPEVVSPSEQDGADAGAYFVFDCPPSGERFYVRLEDPAVIAEARAILRGDYEAHLTGDIVPGTVYYNERWQFHVDPASVRFVDSDPGFADQMSGAAEAQLKRGKAVFPPDDIWHTGGARLLAELPPGWFATERDGRQDEERAVLRAHGRVADGASL